MAALPALALALTKAQESLSQASRPAGNKQAGKSEASGDRSDFASESQIASSQPSALPSTTSTPPLHDDEAWTAANGEGSDEQASAHDSPLPFLHPSSRRVAAASSIFTPNPSPFPTTAPPSVSMSIEGPAAVGVRPLSFPTCGGHVLSGVSDAPGVENGLQFKVTRRAVGLIIGTAGERVKAIRQKTRAEVHISKDEDGAGTVILSGARLLATMRLAEGFVYPTCPPAPQVYCWGICTERLCLAPPVAGSRESVHQARLAILQLLEAEPANGPTTRREVKLGCQVHRPPPLEYDFPPPLRAVILSMILESC